MIVLKNAGPLGAPGMPEWGQLPIPKKLLEQGVRDMVRISDARMSGTSYGACVLHVAPESYVGGPLALVRDGDMIVLDVAARRLQLDVDDAELARRRAAMAQARAALRARLRRAVPESHQRRRTTAATSISSKARRRRRSRKSTSTAAPTRRPHMRALEPAKLVALVTAMMQRAGSSADEARNDRAPARRRELRRPRFARRASASASISNGCAKAGCGPISRRRSRSSRDAIAIVDGNRGFGQVIGEFASEARHRQGGEERASR